jgi:hypothetical protein
MRRISVNPYTWLRSTFVEMRARSCWRRIRATRRRLRPVNLSL